MQHLLAFVHALDGLYLVAQSCCLLEFEAVGRFQHPALDALDDLLGLPFQKVRNLIDDLSVPVLVHRANARAGTAMYEVVQAGARIVAGDVLGA